MKKMNKIEMYELIRAIFIDENKQELVDFCSKNIKYEILKDNLTYCVFSVLEFTNNALTAEEIFFQIEWDDITIMAVRARLAQLLKYNLIIKEVRLIDGKYKTFYKSI